MSAGVSQGRGLRSIVRLEPTPFFPVMPDTSLAPTRGTRLRRLCTGPTKHEDPDYEKEPVCTIVTQLFNLHVSYDSNCHL